MSVENELWIKAILPQHFSPSTSYLICLANSSTYSIDVIASPVTTERPPVTFPTTNATVIDSSAATTTTVVAKMGSRPS